jgi:hypothetical protein
MFDNVTRFAMSAVLVTAALGVASCGAGGESDPPSSSEPRVATFRVITQESQIKLPLDAYELTRDQRVQQSDAQYLLTRACMERFGVPFTQPRQPASAFLDLNNDRKFGLFNAQVAEQYGFQPPPDPSSEEAETEWSPSPQELAVLDPGSSASRQVAAPVDVNGDPVPKGGCVGESLRRIDFQPNDNPQVDSHELYVRAQADSRTRKGFERWSTCMAAKGFDYDSPIDVIDKTWPQPVSPLEIKTAVAHVDCAKTTNMVGTWVSVLAAYQQRAIEQKPEYFATLQARNEKMVRAAAAALSGPDS